MTVRFPDIEAAHKRVRAVLDVTPLTYSPQFSERLEREIYIKWDNRLRTGSFKERGAVNALECLDRKQRGRGVCTASAGNHALALSYHAGRMKIACLVVMPTSAPLVKVQATQNAGAEVVLHGPTLAEAYDHALQLSKSRGLQFIPPYDDERIVAGQGTCGLELLEQLDDFDAVVVPIGGGGLMSGIATAIKARRPGVYLLGVQSEWAVRARKAHAAKAKRSHFPAELPAATIADGIAVKRPGKVTQPILDALVDKIVSVSESQIARAIVQFVECEHAVIEGAGAAAMAAALEGHLPKSKRKAIVLACGSNIDNNALSRLLERDMGERGRLLKLQVSVPDRPGSLAFTTGIFARAGANILEVIHDRSFSRIPSNVDITFELEVKNAEHRARILAELESSGITAVEM